MRHKCNPAILDLDGTQSWPLAGEVIRRMASDDAPEALRDCRVVALDWEALLAGIPESDELQHMPTYSETNPSHQRLAALFSTIRCSEEHIILFVEHFHRLLGGEWERYPVDAFQLLKPALARSEIQLPATCTLDSYRRYVERDAAIQRRMRQLP